MKSQPYAKARFVTTRRKLRLRLQLRPSNLQARPTKKRQLSASVDATTGNSTRYSYVENHYNAALCSISKSLSLLTQLAGDPLEKNGVMLLRGNQQRHQRRRPHRRRNIGRALQLTMII